MPSRSSQQMGSLEPAALSDPPHCTVTGPNRTDQRCIPLRSERDETKFVRKCADLGKLAPPEGGTQMVAYVTCDFMLAGS
jgi:hypothetical protein